MGPESLIYACDNLENSLHYTPRTCAFSVCVSYFNIKLYQNRAMPRPIRRGLRAGFCPGPTSLDLSFNVCLAFVSEVRVSAHKVLIGFLRGLGLLPVGT